VQRGCGDREQPDSPDEAVMPVFERDNFRHQRARDQHEGGDVEHDRGHGQRQAEFPVGRPHGVVSEPAAGGSFQRRYAAKFVGPDRWQN
jgi:hypothetical protein